MCVIMLIPGEFRRLIGDMNHAMVRLMCHIRQESAWVSSAEGPRYGALKWGRVARAAFSQLVLKHYLWQSKETDPVSLVGVMYKAL